MLKLFVVRALFKDVYLRSVCLGPQNSKLLGNTKLGREKMRDMWRGCVVLLCSESKCPRGGVYVAASSEVGVEADERGENPEELSTLLLFLLLFFCFSFFRFRSLSWKRGGSERVSDGVCCGSEAEAQGLKVEAPV